LYSFKLKADTFKLRLGSWAAGLEHVDVCSVIIMQTLHFKLKIRQKSFVPLGEEL